MTRAILCAAAAAALCLAAGCGNLGSSEGEKVMAAQLVEAQRKVASVEADNRRLNDDVHRALEERGKFQHDLEIRTAILAERDTLIASLQAQVKEQTARFDGLKEQAEKMAAELTSIREMLAGGKKAPATP